MHEVRQFLLYKPHNKKKLYNLMIKYRKDNQHLLKCDSHTLPVTSNTFSIYIQSRHYIIYHLKDGRAHIFLINITFSPRHLSVYCILDEIG